MEMDKIRKNQCEFCSGKLILMQLLKSLKGLTRAIKELRGIRTKVLAPIKGDYNM